MKRVGEVCAVVAATGVLAFGISAETHEPTLSEQALAHERQVSAGRYTGGCVLKKVVTKGWKRSGLPRREVEVTVDLTASKEALTLDKGNDVGLVGIVAGRAGILNQGHVYSIQPETPLMDISISKGEASFSVLPHNRHTPGEKAAVYVRAIAASQHEGMTTYTSARTFCGTMVVGAESVWKLDSSRPPLPTQFWTQ